MAEGFSNFVKLSISYNILIILFTLNEDEIFELLFSVYHILTS